MRGRTLPDQLGTLALEGGHTDRAEALHEGSLSLHGRLGDRAGRAYAPTNPDDVWRGRGG